MYRVLIIFAFCLASCGTKKEVFTADNSTRVDTVRIIEKQIVQPPSANRLIIRKICDTITKEVIKFRKVVEVNGDSLEIMTNENNELIIQNNKQKKTLQTMKDSYEKLLREKEKTKIEIRYKTNWDFVILAGIIGLILGVVGRRKFIF